MAVYDPALPLQESAELPDAVTLAGVSVQVNPVLGETVAVRPTLPMKP